MIKLARGNNVQMVRDPQNIPRGSLGRDEHTELELHGLDDVTASAFGRAKVQISHGPGGPVPPPFAARVYLREPNRFAYPRIFEYLEEKPPMTFLAWCLAFQLLTPAHVFSALASHESNVDPSDMVELLSTLGDFYLHNNHATLSY